MKKLFYIFALVALPLFLGSVSPALSQSYTLTDLGALNYPWCPCDYTKGVDVTDGGNILIQTGPYAWPTVWSSDGTITPVVVTSGSASGGQGYALLGGTVVGRAAAGTGGLGFRGSGTSVTFLNYYPYDISGAGIIGYRISDYGPWAVAVINGTPINVTTGSLGAYGFGVNDLGQVTGRAQLVPDANWHAYLWTSGVTTDLGTLDGGSSEGWKVNNLGHVVGNATTTLDGIHPFFWDGSAMIDLGSLGGSGSAYGINDRDQVVGASGQSAFIWEHGMMTDLNVACGNIAGWRLTWANAINNNGWIVGWGEYQGGIRGFLLKPGGATSARKTTWGQLKSLYR